MKKFLLCLAAMLSLALYSQAETVTFDFTGDEGYGMTLLENGTSDYNPNPTVLESGSVTITLNGTSRWWKTSSGNQLRMYKQSSLSVSVPDGYHLEKVVLNALRPTDFAGDGYNNGTWTGSLQTVTLNCTVESGNTPIYSIEATYAAGDATGETGDTGETEYGKYAKATTMEAGKYVLQASDIIATPLSASYGYLPVVDAVFVDGNVVTDVNNAFEFVATDGGYYMLDNAGNYYYMKQTFNSFNVSEEVLDDADFGYVWEVTVESDGTFRIKNVLKQKSIQYSESYTSFGSYSEDTNILPVLYKYAGEASDPGTGDEPEPEYTSVTALAQLYSLANKTDIQIDVETVVVYAFNSYVYVYDGADYALIYKYGLGLEKGQTIAKGWKAAISIYNNLVEVVPADETLAGVAGGEVPQPVEITEDNAELMLVASNQNKFVRILNVVFDEATPEKGAFSGTLGSETINFYQRFGLEPVEAGAYDLEGFISVYGETVQVQPIVMGVAGGIAGVEADQAPAVYYNLQGIRVANPRNGNIYIRVQGDKAQKVAL